MKLLAFIFLCISQFSLATDDPYFEIANSYHEASAKLSCEFTGQKIKEIKYKTDLEIKKEIESEILKLESILKITEDEDLKDDLIQLRAELKSHQKALKPKKRIIRFLEKTCEIARYPIAYSARALAITNSVLFNTALLPLSTIVGFFDGMLSGRHKSHISKRDELLYRIMGPKNGVSSYLLTNIAYTVPDLFLKINPIYLGFTASLSVEMITNYSCFNLNEESRTDRKKFCRDYQNLKDFFYQPKKEVLKLVKSYKHFLINDF
jgi:hypothetical protein